jgi:hypothetical protein
LKGSVVNSPPLFDTGAVARVREALLGGHIAYDRERNVAAWLEERYPGLGEMVAASMRCHADAALQAVTGKLGAPPAAGVIFTAAGVQPPPPRPGEPARRPLHAAAAEAAPRARYVYFELDEGVADTNVQLLAGDGRARVASAPSWDPGRLLAAPQARELTRTGPVSVHVILAAARWPGDVAAQVTAEYARLLPKGSTLVMSLLVADECEAGREMMRDSGTVGSRCYCHTDDDMRGWFEGAGLRLRKPGVASVRAIARPWVEPYRIAPLIPGRPVGAVGIKD